MDSFLMKIIPIVVKSLIACGNVQKRIITCNEIIRNKNGFLENFKDFQLF